MADRIRHVKSVREAEQLQDEYVTQGYKVQSSGESSIVVRKSSWGSIAGHAVVALFTIWWTIGIGNLIYAVVAHKSDEVLIKVDPEGDPA